MVKCFCSYCLDVNNGFGLALNILREKIYATVSNNFKGNIGKHLPPNIKAKSS